MEIVGTGFHFQDLPVVRTRNEIVKQDGTKVITYTPLRMVKRRTAAQA